MKKIKINYLGNEFLINEKYFRNTDYNGNKMTPTLTVNQVVGATMIKQFVKKHFKGIKVWSTSETFSMGNAIDVNLSNIDGSPIPTKDYETIKSFASSLKAGYFNGMEDIYEYDNRNRKTDDGLSLDIYCKFISVNNSPKFGTLEWGVDRIKRNGETPEDLLYYIDNNKKEKFLEIIKS